MLWKLKKKRRNFTVLNPNWEYPPPPKKKITDLDPNLDKKDIKLQQRWFTLNISSSKYYKKYPRIFLYPYFIINLVNRWGWWLLILVRLWIRWSDPLGVKSTWRRRLTAWWGWWTGWRTPSGCTTLASSRTPRSGQPCWWSDHRYQERTPGFPSFSLLNLVAPPLQYASKTIEE